MTASKLPEFDVFVSLPSNVADAFEVKEANGWFILSFLNRGREIVRLTVWSAEALDAIGQQIQWATQNRKVVEGQAKGFTPEQVMAGKAQRAPAQGGDPATPGERGGARAREGSA